MRAFHRGFFLVSAIALAACAIDTAPDSLKSTPPGDGPTVIFDLAHRPLPNIPVPNDVATFPDPSSRTGLRLNVSMIAPTHLEANARQGFTEMEGWGTFAPITVAFNRGAHDDAHDAALDLADVAARMQKDGHDTSNDPVYVINLKTGVPVLVDVGDGDFPIAVAHQDPYYPNDPHLKSNTLLFETNEEGAGLTQADYTPARDVDFDGVLDHPNTLGGVGPNGIDGVDNVMSWYERQSDTLILQPVLPMDEKTEYAVVLTDRLHGSGGDPVKSPFPSIYHPTQRDEAARVRDILSDPNRSNYYGDIAGSGLDHVAFTWSFTTEPTYEDLRLLRDGLYGKGPLSNLSALYPPNATAYPAIGLAATDADEPAGYQNDARCAPHMGTPFILHPADAKDAIQLLIQQLFTQSKASSDAFISTFDQIDYVVTGSYQTPYFLGDPDHENPDARFQIDFKNGIVENAGSDKGHFFLTVPKRKPGQTGPFPVVLWAHGTSQSDAEIVARAGYFAAQGLAIFGIDMPGHGLALQAGQLSLAEGFFNDTCMVPFPYGLDQGRARDLNGDGILDSGGLLFTSHIFHSRDNLRQTVVDLMQASRILRAFGSPGTQDVNNDGKPDLMGDFDGDGVPDVGGPTAKIYAAGDSYGGIVSQIVGALDPNITAVAPISGSGGLTGIAERSFGVVDWVDEQILTPLIVAVPASSRPPTASGVSQTNCTGDQRSVRIVVNDLQNSREIEIACLSSDELPENATVLLENGMNNELRCARTGKDGAFRVPVPADAGDALGLQIYNAPDVVDSYKTCNVQASAQPGRLITTWEQPEPAAAATSVGDSGAECTADAGCAQYRDTFYAVGSQLVAPQAGLGLYRNSPEVRQLLNLTQAALDVADPVDFAPYYMMKPMPGLDGTPMGPRAMLTSYTVGDGFVNIATGYAFARALGALPFLPPAAITKMPDYAPYATPPALYASLGGTPDAALVAHAQIEGVSRLARTPAGPTCTANYKGGPSCDPNPGMSKDACNTTLFDADWFSEGTDLFDQQHLPVPLRLARLATEPGNDAASLDRAWAPRMQGAPFTPDANAYTPTAAPFVGVVGAYVNPQGQHVWLIGDPCKSWDDAVYYDELITRFMMTNGTDVYFLSHPKTHGCLATESCDFFGAGP